MINMSLVRDAVVLGKPYYWQDGGWHGLHVPVRATAHNVWFCDHDDKLDLDNIHRSSMNEWHKDRDRADSAVSEGFGYANMHKEDLNNMYNIKTGEVI
jgi:hypothetical protein